jgi:hypothetical protein
MHSFMIKSVITFHLFSQATAAKIPMGFPKLIAAKCTLDATDIARLVRSYALEIEGLASG